MSFPAAAGSDPDSTEQTEEAEDEEDDDGDGEEEEEEEEEETMIEYELFKEMRRNPLAKNPFFVKNVAARFTVEGSQGLDPGKINVLQMLYSN